MLSVQITNKHNITQTFTEEFIDFTWSTRNNEGADFSASVPNLASNIILCVVNDFTRSIDRAAKIKVFSDNGGLQLSLSVIEVTNLDAKGICEISCTGNFLTETNSVFGVLTVPAADWATTQEKYGLEMVEAHESNHETLVNAEKKEDIVLALAWNFPERRNVAVTPFTTGDGSFAGDGIGLFRNAKVADNCPVAPVYRIEAEQIINYGVEAAQPPVTHLQTSSLGNLGPTPQIPAISISKYTGGVDDDTIGKYARPYYIEETQLSAIWALSEANDFSTISQTLSWSDGVHTTWLPADYPQPRKIIGLFEDSFVEVVNGTTVNIVDRTDLENIRATLTVDNTDNLWLDETGRAFTAFKTNRLQANDQYPNQRTLYVLWFKVITPGGYFGIAFDGNNYTLLRSTQTGGYSDYYFVESCKVRHISTDSGNEYFVEGFYTNGTKQLGLSVTTLTASGNTVLYRDEMPDIVTNFAETTPLDFIASERKASATAPAYVLCRGWIPVYGPFMGAQEITDVSSVKFGSVVSDLIPNGQWIIDKDVIGPSYADSVMLWISLDVWRIVLQTSVELLSVLQSGSVGEWAGTSFYYTLARNVFMTAIYKGGNYWNLYLQISAVPFLSRVKGDLALSQRIAEGNNNVIALPFKVGALQQRDKFHWDKDNGRIEIDLAGFYVRNNANGVWLKKDIQHLNVIAVSSYVEVKLNPDDTHYTLVKVTGFSLSYRGDVGAKLSGIITE